MYYEETVVNGVLCFRTTPNTPFVEFSKERLTAKIKELELKIQSQEKPSQYEKAPWWANPDLPLPKVTC